MNVQAAWGFCIGMWLMIAISVLITGPQQYERGVRDCMNGRAVITIAQDTTITEP